METQFITNESGEKLAVIVPIKEYERLIEESEDMEDLRALEEAETIDEEAIPLEDAFQIIEAERRKIGK